MIPTEGAAPSDHCDRFRLFWRDA